ncbi:unnamed protein product [Penicillium salamii]|nr:unnamed protein product [Penicillium salamii]CAG8264196.1 unnamed protein product [Penicillium salamii]
MSSKIVRVGIIGCGEIAQVVHIPVLGHLSHLFQITYLCDVSQSALAHCQSKVNGAQPQITLDAEELCASPMVDVVFVINSDEYHAAHAILALQHNKHAFIEKPMALNERDADALISAERASVGRVMVGYMRRYAPAFVDAVKEIGGMDKILYARVRGWSRNFSSNNVFANISRPDIIGPNSTSVGQSGTFPFRATDFNEKDTQDKKTRATDIVRQGLAEAGLEEFDDSMAMMWRVLGGLGSHDLSVMREALGMPTGVIGASLKMPFWSAIFQYPSFTVTYESGIDSVPRFDAHLEVYSAEKTVRVQYDSPYVKGLPTTMHVVENVDGVFRESTIRKTYEDSYTLELKELHAMIVEGAPIRTTAQDAKEDLKIFRMLVKAAERKP